MTTRNIKQYVASVNKLAKDELKFTDIVTIVDNGEPVVVSSEHDDVVELASVLRKLATKLLADEREFANSEMINRIMKDKSLIAEYARKMQASSEPKTSEVKATPNVVVDNEHANEDSRWQTSL